MPPVTRSDFPYPLRTIDGRVKLDINGEDITFNTFPANTNLQLDGANNIFGNGQTGSGSNVLQTNPSLVNAYTDKITVTDLDASSSVQTNIVKGLITIPNTGTGGNVLETTPTINSANLVTPSLGVATATDVTINNLTPNNAVQTDGSNKLVSIANSGSGDNVLRINPQLVNPVLGTASATSINISSLAANSAVQTNGSSTLVTITNEGTGNNILQTSPTLITPDIGVATGTSLETTGNVESDQILVSNRLAGFGLVVNSTTESTSSATGCARFIGGVGVGGNVYVGGDVNTVATVDCEDLKANSPLSSSSKATGAIQCLGGIGCEDIYVDSTQQGVSKTNAAIKCQGGVGCEDIYVNSTTTAISLTTAAIKCQGGIGCKDVWVNDTTSATSKTSAAIKCQGGVGCEDLYVNTTARIPAITSLSTLNGLAFVYSTGTFSPTLTTNDPANDGAFAIEITPTYTRQIGKWYRIGNMATIYVDLAFTCNNLINLLSVALEQGVPFTPEAGTTAIYSGKYAENDILNPNPFDENWFNMEPITLTGGEDMQPCSMWNGDTSRWEQRAWAKDAITGWVRKEYFYIGGAGPAGLDNYRILYTCHCLVA